MSCSELVFSCPDGYERDGALCYPSCNGHIVNLAMLIMAPSAGEMLTFMAKAASLVAAVAIDIINRI